MISATGQSHEESWVREQAHIGWRRQRLEQKFDYCLEIMSRDSRRGAMGCVLVERALLSQRLHTTSATTGLGQAYAAATADDCKAHIKRPGLLA
jgi:hypothetical protein